MSLPNLDIIALPDLTDLTSYPNVDHDVKDSCVDPGFIDPKPCWPFAALYRVRPFTHPTEALGVIKFQFLRIRNLFPTPPSVGVHCATIEAPPPSVSMIPGDADDADWTRNLVQPQDDACQVRLTDVLQIPCIFPNWDTGIVKNQFAVNVGTTEVVLVSGVGCNKTFQVNATITLPTIPSGATGITGPTGPSNAGPLVGLRMIIAGDAFLWATSLGCINDIDAAVFDPGDDIPLLEDVGGALVAPGTNVGSGAGAPGNDYEFENGEDIPLFAGDTVMVVRQNNPAPATGVADTWIAYKR